LKSCVVLQYTTVLWFPFFDKYFQQIGALLDNGVLADNEFEAFRPWVDIA